MKAKLLSILLVAFSLISLPAQATVRYVKTNGTTTAANAANAKSWSTACSNLQAVINASVAGDEIWVAAGTYKPQYTAEGYSTYYDTYPTTNGNRNNAFVLKSGVKIYGGFAGTETSLTSRNWKSYKTILSGDIGTTNNTSDNCYHVVISSGNVTTACLDGFTISGGNANGETTNIYVNMRSLSPHLGGGVYTRESSPTLSNLEISGNTAETSGGGMYNSSKASPTLTNVSITKNTASSGAGMYNVAESFPTLSNVTISENTASISGGGMFNNSSSPILKNVTISGNTAESSGGGIYNTHTSTSLTDVKISKNKANSFGGGIYNSQSSYTLTNVEISENIGNSGGGIYNDKSSPILRNVIISKNQASWGSGMYNGNSSSPILTDVKISKNTGDVGSGMYNNTSSPVLTNVEISGNESSSDGAGMNNYKSSPILTNVEISGNISAKYGGGMFNRESSPTLTNVTISGNTALAGVGIYSFSSSSAKVYNSIIGRNGEKNIYGSFGTCSYSLVEGLNLETYPDNNKNTNPNFVNPSNGDYSLSEGSPAINAGSNSFYLTARGLSNFTNEFDLTGNPRLFGTSIDMGAYEYSDGSAIDIPMPKDDDLYALRTDDGLLVKGLIPGEVFCVINIQGQVIYRGTAVDSKQSVQIGSSGIYIIAAGKRATKVFVGM